MANVVTIECIDEDPGGIRWLAYDYDADPSPIGRGATEQEALDNLRSRIDAHHDRNRAQGLDAGTGSASASGEPPEAC